MHMPDLVSAQINEGNVRPLVDEGRLMAPDHLPDERLDEVLEEGMLCVARFAASLEEDVARRVLLYRVTGWGDGAIDLEPLTDLNERLGLDLDDWPRLRMVPLGLRAVYMWSVTTRSDAPGLEPLLNPEGIEKADLLERYFLVPVDDIDDAEQTVRDHESLRAGDRFVCYHIGEESLQVRVLATDDGETVSVLQETPGAVVAEYEFTLDDLATADRRGREEVRRIWALMRPSPSFPTIRYGAITCWLSRRWSNVR